MKSLAVHSHKGGVGKSTISVNIAVELAKENNVFIVDIDLAGPSLQTFFPNTTTYFNEFLAQNVELAECIQEYRDPKLNGKLYYTNSNPMNEGINSVLRMNKKSATMMLRQLILMKNTLEEEFDIDYLIIDTSPGVNITAANAFVATDNILFVNKLSNADIDGSANMIGEILQYMDNKAYMVANQIPQIKVKEKKHLINLVQNHLHSKIGNDIITLVGILPMDFNLQLMEYETAQQMMKGKEQLKNGRSNRHIYALDEPDSLFMEYLKPVIAAVFG